MADGPLPPLQRPERAWFISFLYPLRGAECLGVIAVLALISWVFFVLVPEYCLTAMRDALSMGAGLMGMLFVLIAAVPVVLLSPFLISYGLQYLGRILVSEPRWARRSRRARTPDRNFDGFLQRAEPLVHLLARPGPRRRPACPPRGMVSSCAASRQACQRHPGGHPGSWQQLPYILAALMMSFLHDDPIAPKPWSVIHGIFRLGCSFSGAEPPS